MPEWLAHLTPWLDDSPSEAAWSAIVRRYAALARRWGVLDAEAWERARIGALIAIVSEARMHCPAIATEAIAAIDEVLAWLRRGAPDLGRLAAQWRAEAAADALAAATGRCAPRSAAAAAGASAKAAWASAEAAASACSAAGARAEASDRIAIGVLDAIEREIVAAGGER